MLKVGQSLNFNTKLLLSGVSVGKNADGVLNTFPLAGKVGNATELFYLCTAF